MPTARSQLRLKSVYNTQFGKNKEKVNFWGKNVFSFIGAKRGSLFRPNFVSFNFYLYPFSTAASPPSLKESLQTISKALPTLHWLWSFHNICCRCRQCLFVAQVANYFCLLFEFFSWLGFLNFFPPPSHIALIPVFASHMVLLGFFLWFLSFGYPMTSQTLWSVWQQALWACTQ